jgi:hypothetical protein
MRSAGMGEDSTCSPGVRGFTSEMLLKYGFRPRRPPVRKKKGETPSAAATPAANQP